VYEAHRSCRGVSRGGAGNRLDRNASHLSKKVSFPLIVGMTPCDEGVGVRQGRVQPEATKRRDNCSRKQLTTQSIWSSEWRRGGAVIDGLVYAMAL
jgi:hypothetical protein